MHSLFINEHNHIAGMIEENKKKHDEDFYHLTRKNVGAEIQNIRIEICMKTVGYAGIISACCWCHLSISSKSNRHVQVCV